MADDKKQSGTSTSSGTRTITESDNTAALTHKIDRTTGIFDGTRGYSDNVQNTMPPPPNPNRGSGNKDE